MLDEAEQCGSRVTIHTLFTNVTQWLIIQKARRDKNRIQVKYFGIQVSLK